MSYAYRSRKKAIKKLRKAGQIEKDISIVQAFALPANKSWVGVAARLALKDRGF